MHRLSTAAGALATLAALAFLAVPGCGERESRTASPAAPETPAPAESAKMAEPAPATGGLPPGGPPEMPPPLMPRGLVTNEPGVAQGYVLFNPILSDTTYLVDNEGRVVHLWKTSYTGGGGLMLLSNGHLIRLARDPDMLGFRAGGTAGILQELDWKGKVVWEWKFATAEHVLHHDIEVLPNGNILAIAWEVKTPEQARQAGRRPDHTPDQGLWPDWVLEVHPQPPDGGEIVWEWHVWDHLIQNFDPKAQGYGDPAASPGRLDVNAMSESVGGPPVVDAAQLDQLKALGYVPADARPQDLESDFLHVNAVTYHPRLDQIALSVPALGEVWVIDHSISTADAAGPKGDFLYRWGNPGAYGRKGVKRFFYQHDVRWIPDGWPGAGRMTVFNNGLHRPEGPWSSVDEWMPPIDEKGRYAPVSSAVPPWGPAELTWRYKGDPPESFFAPFISGAQRLANGNTLVCAGTDGRFFEVTREGKIVWEYRNPFSGEGRLSDGTMPQPGLDKSPYAVFRATRIPADHPAVVRRSLAPLDPQPAWHEVDGEEPAAAD